MKKYATYKMNYKGFDIEYLITERPYYPKELYRVLLATIRFKGKTVRYIEKKIPTKDKLNDDLQKAIEQYITGYCDYNEYQWKGEK